MVRCGLLFGGVLALFLPFQFALGASIVGSKHDLSSSNYYGSFGSEGTEICVFCHTPHGFNTDLNQNGINDQTEDGAAAPLWNRRLTDASASVFQMYTSSTMNADCAATPSPVTLACLSCHDTALTGGLGDPTGAVNGAVGWTDTHNLVNPSNAMPNMGGPPVGWSNAPNCKACHPSLRGGGSFYPDPQLWAIGPDLSNDHPVSIIYADAAAADPDIKPVPEPGVQLFNGRVECPSCHNPHNPTNVPFLRVPVTGSALCYKCHDK